MKKVLLVLSLIMFSSPVYAEEKLTMEGFLDLYNKGGLETKKLMHNQLRAMTQGMGWSNTELRANKRKPIYCPPSKLNITGEQAYDIFEKNLKKRRNWREINMRGYGLFLLLGLKETFPCK